MRRPFRPAPLSKQIVPTERILKNDLKKRSNRSQETIPPGARPAKPAQGKTEEKIQQKNSAKRGPRENTPTRPLP
jgi:hypothetical protein